MVSIMPVYDNPDAEHARLEREIGALLKALGWDSDKLNKYVDKTYESDTRWQDQCISTKEELKALLVRINNYLSVKSAEKAEGESHANIRSNTELITQS